MASRLMLPLVDKYVVERAALGSRLGRGAIGRLESLAKEFDATGKWHSTINAEFVKRWFIHRPHLKPNSRRVYAATIRAFLRWGVQGGLFKDRSVIDFNPGRTSHHRSKEPIWLTRDQVQDVITAQNWYWRGLVAFISLTMVRQSEAITLTIGDIDGEFVNVTRHKTTKFDRLPLMPDALDELELYLIAYENNIGRPLEPGMVLFPPIRNPRNSGVYIPNPYALRKTPVSEKIKRMIRPWIPQGDNNEACRGLGAHSLRRSAARAFYEWLTEQGETDAMRIVQGMLGHDDITMTQLYIGMDSVAVVRNRAVSKARGFMPARAKVLDFPQAEGRTLRAVTEGTG